MYPNTLNPGQGTGLPDVCLVPTPVGPVATPFVNMATTALGMPLVQNVLIAGAPVHNLSTSILLTSGDEAGLNLGVASGTIKGPTRALTGAFTCLMGGAPVTRMNDTYMGNTTNCMGSYAVPSQLRVQVLSA